jgi:hypothetical protein
MPEVRRPVLRSAEPACRTDAADRRIYLLIRGQDPDGASPESGNRPKGAPRRGPFFMEAAQVVAGDHPSIVGARRNHTSEE